MGVGENLGPWVVVAILAGRCASFLEGWKSERASRGYDRDGLGRLVWAVVEAGLNLFVAGW